MLEVEQKYRVADVPNLLLRLDQLGGIKRSEETNADTYYRHPCRDFAKTNEAFRIRRINDVAAVTYKGPKLAVSDSTLKAREEIEWSLAPNDASGLQMESLLAALSFTPVTTVFKQRQTFGWPTTHSSWSKLSVTVDDVVDVGTFAEIEALVQDPADVEPIGNLINELAEQLELRERVANSYLSMLLRNQGIE